MSEQDPGPQSTRDSWLDRHLWEIQPVRDVLVVLVILGLFWLGQKISIVTVPLLLAMLFAYLLEPVVAYLMSRTRLQRRGSVVLIMVATILLVVVPAVLGIVFGVVQSVGLVSQLANSSALVYESVDVHRRVRDVQDEIRRLESSEASAEEEKPPAGEGATPEADAAPSSQIDDARVAQLRSELARLRAEANAKRARVEDEAGRSWLWIHDRLVASDESGTLDAAFRVFQVWLESNAALLAQSAAATGASVLQTTIAFLTRAFTILFMVFLTSFFFFFMSTQWPGVRRFITRLIPEKHKETVVDLAVKFDRVISGFIRGRLTIAFLQSIVFTLGFALIGVPASFILGPIIAILSIVPYLALVGLPVSIVLLWLENHAGIRGTWWYVLLAPTIFYHLAQALDDYVWTPLIQGKSTEMSTPMILFASIAGGALFGVFGLLIAIPLAACIKIAISELVWPVFRDWAEGRRKDLLPFGAGRRAD